MFEFWKNEWKLFLEDLDAVKNAFGRIFGRKQDYTYDIYYEQSK